MKHHNVMQSSYRDFLNGIHENVGDLKVFQRGFPLTLSPQEGGEAHLGQGKK